jgi:hypothetical protein
MANMARGFKEVDVTNFSSQQRVQRVRRHPTARWHNASVTDSIQFPSTARHQQNFPPWGLEEDPSNSDDEGGLPPRIAEWRSNLVCNNPISIHGIVSETLRQKKSLKDLILILIESTFPQSFLKLRTLNVAVLMPL